VIYRDPITRLRPEGMATLKKLVYADGETQRWMVRFDGELECFERTICVAGETRISPISTKEAA